MKKNITTPLAALAALAFSLSSCSTSENLDNAVVSMEPAAVQTEAADFSRQYEAETRSAGLATTETALYDNMFSELNNTAEYNFMDLARSNSNLSTFTELLREANLLSLIEVTGQEFTVFAPTNAAFAALPAGKLEELRKPQNHAQLVEFLQAHLLAQPITVSQFENNQQVQFGNDKYIPITVSEEGTRQVTVGGATIVKPDVKASNGIIHVVDAVIQPAGMYDVTE